MRWWAVVTAAALCLPCGGQSSAPASRPGSGTTLTITLSWDAARGATVRALGSWHGMDEVWLLQRLKAEQRRAVASRSTWDVVLAVGADVPWADVVDVAGLAHGAGAARVALPGVSPVLVPDVPYWLPAGDVEEVRVLLTWDATTRSLTLRLGGRVLTEAGLRTALQRAHQWFVDRNKPDTPVILDADADVSWPEVIRVMNLCKQLGITRVEFALGRAQPAAAPASAPASQPASLLRLRHSGTGCGARCAEARHWAVELGGVATAPDTLVAAWERVRAADVRLEADPGLPFEFLRDVLQRCHAAGIRQLIVR